MDTIREDINEVLSADADYVVWYETLEREHEEALYNKWLSDQDKYAAAEGMFV